MPYILFETSIQHTQMLLGICRALCKDSYLQCVTLNFIEASKATWRCVSVNTGSGNGVSCFRHHYLKQCWLFVNLTLTHWGRDKMAIFCKRHFQNHFLGRCLLYLGPFNNNITFIGLVPSTGHYPNQQWASLLTGPMSLGANINNIFIKIQIFSFTKMRLKISSAQTSVCQNGRINTPYMECWSYQELLTPIYKFLVVCDYVTLNVAFPYTKLWKTLRNMLHLNSRVYITHCIC